MGTDKQEKVRWKKGQSGNPKGRPHKEHCLITIMEQYLAYTNAQLKAEAAKPLALANQLAIKYLLDCYSHPMRTEKLMDRLYGQPTQATDVTSGGLPIKMETKIVQFSTNDVAAAILEAVRLNISPELLGSNGHGESAPLLSAQANTETTVILGANN